VKLYVTRHALATRRTYPQLFATGAYLPLRTGGARRRHVCAFARVLGRDAVVAVAPVLIAGLTGARPIPPIGPDVWSDTWLRLPPGGARFRNAFTGEELVGTSIGGRAGLWLRDVLAAFPVALLARM